MLEQHATSSQCETHLAVLHSPFLCAEDVKDEHYISQCKEHNTRRLVILGGGPEMTFLQRNVGKDASTYLPPKTCASTTQEPNELSN